MATGIKTTMGIDYDRNGIEELYEIDDAEY